MPFIPVARLEDIAPLGARRYRRADGVQIAIFRTEANTVFALRDKCPHKGGPLSQGIVFGESVACPLHNWCIGLKTGEAAAPDIGSVERFEVKVENGIVLLDPTSSVVPASFVIPAEAGIQQPGPRFRGDDESTGGTYKACASASPCAKPA